VNGREAERAAALAPPRAHGPPASAGRLRSAPEDFVVEEQLGFAPAGSGQHLLLRVQKRAANTQWVARALARAAGCRPGDVGYAGLKDRHALVVQWFSVPRPRQSVSWPGLRGEGFEVLEEHAHHRKLPRGALAGNRFAIRVRGDAAQGPTLAAALAPRLEILRERGVPNYFGAQRFGREGANLLPEDAPLPSVGAPQRGFVLSAARSLLFNAVLAARVEEGSWERLLEGEIVNLDGRGSIFAADPADALLPARCARLEIHPTGPLWGRGPPPSSGAVLALESRLAAEFAHACARCTAAGLPQERRSLRLRVAALEMLTEPDAVLLRFELPRGAFATTVLRELIETPEELAELTGGDQ
jgi:tRNA pseudouridine13 synthase